MGEDGTENTGLPKDGGKQRRIRRKAYTRRGTRVRARMIRDMGAPGKWKSKHMGTPGIGPLKQGDLQAVGYSVSAPATRRHAAIDQAIRKYGKLSTLRKLNAVAVYTRRTSPVKSRIFKADVRYVQTK